MEFHKVIEFHKVRFISLDPVVQRTVDLVDSGVLQRYFDERIKSEKVAKKKKELKALQEKVLDTKFLLYIFFLSDCLPHLAEVIKV